MSFETEQADVGFDPLAKRCIAVCSEGALKHIDSLGSRALFGQLPGLHFDLANSVLFRSGRMDQRDRCTAR
jgi:hypothetical protein